MPDEGDLVEYRLGEGKPWRAGRVTAAGFWSVQVQDLRTGRFVVVPQRDCR